MWRRMVGRIDGVVVGEYRDAVLGSRTPVCHDLTTFVSFKDQHEAHYFCAMLNSCFSTVISLSYSTGKSFGSPHILQHVAIPKFALSNTVHQSLASLSQRAHQLAARGKDGEADLRQVQAEIDRLAARLWGLTEPELTEVRVASPS